MFNPTQDEVRRFYCETFRKLRANEILTPMEAMAGDWIRQHPEYDEVFSDVESALQRDYSVDNGQANPFLHLSMHVAIDEQISVDKPAGIRAAATELTLRLDSAHEAQHQIIECLGEMLWEAARNGVPPDGNVYLEKVRRLLK